MRARYLGVDSVGVRPIVRQQYLDESGIKHYEMKNIRELSRLIEGIGHVRSRDLLVTAASNGVFEQQAYILYM
jgi:hypothetical protein